MIKRLTCLCLVFLFLFGSGQALAVSSDDQHSLNYDSLYYWGNQPQCTGASSSGSSTVLVGNDNEQQAYNFFIQRGLSAVQAAAVVGNFMDESSLNPTAIQNGGNSQDPNAAGGSGWGIAQWTPGSKVLGIAQSLNITGPIYTLATQLDIVWAEMQGIAPTGYKDVASGLAQITDLSQAVTFFQVNFESGDPGSRQQDALQVLEQYGNQIGNSGSSASTVSDTTTNGPCTSSVGAAVNCTPPTSATGNSGGASSNSSLSQTRQSIVCIAQAELALWKNQPNYSSPYPAFTFAATGFLKYTDNNYEEWCADFVSWVYSQAGYPFSGGNSGGWRIAGVSSIQSLAEQNQKFHWHPAGSGYTPQPGDIAIQGASHTNIFISSSGNVSTYIGGDQTGVGQPDGTYGTKNPTSGSIVSTETGSGYYSDGITGYVSPD